MVNLRIQFEYLWSAVLVSVSEDRSNASGLMPLHPWLVEPRTTRLPVFVDLRKWKNVKEGLPISCPHTLLWDRYSKSEAYACKVHAGRRPALPIVRRWLHFTLDARLTICSKR